MVTDPRALVDTYARDRTAATTIPDRSPDGLPTAEWYAPRAFAALRAVLELHQPETFDWVDADREERMSTDCKECDNGGVSDTWPCPTVQAITTALEAT